MATRQFIRRVKAAVGEVDVYVQHHNDLGVATANAMAAVEGGATWIDASVIGIGDRGGCVALEEAATLFEMYGIDTGIRLDKLYELCCYTRDAFGVALPPWKPIAGDTWNKEEGAGHLEGSDAPEATIGLNPEVIGRKFEPVIGGKILFGRERSSAHTDDPVFVRELLTRWGFGSDEALVDTVLLRARAAVATGHGVNYLTLDEFRAICDGAVDRAGK
jgi:isopropylmalate/homocitrate/citramalate synthase